MSRGLVAQTLIAMLFLGTASGPSSGESTSSGIPMPVEIFRNIFRDSNQDDLDTLLDHGFIQKWKGDLKIYFAYADPSEADSINHLIEIQLKPLMISISEATGLGFKRVYTLNESNVAFIFADEPSDVQNFLDLVQLRKWFSARVDREFDDIEAAFRGAPAFCFRFTNAPENEITNAIGFVSTGESETVQEKCLARNILFGVGLRGSTDSPISAKSADTSSRSIGLLDEMALNILYRDGVEPGMTLRQALSK